MEITCSEYIRIEDMISINCKQPIKGFMHPFPLPRLLVQGNGLSVLDQQWAYSVVAFKVLNYKINNITVVIA
jgi:hypothetical protein